MMRVVLSILLAIVVDIVVWFAFLLGISELFSNDYKTIAGIIFIIITMHGTKLISIPLSTMFHKLFKLEEIK